MKSAEATVPVDTLTAQACAQFAASVLPVLPMDGLAVVLLDPEKETSRVVFSLGDPHPTVSSAGRGRGGKAYWGERDPPPMCIPLQGREGELGVVLYRGPTVGSYGPDEDTLVRQSANRLTELLENIQLRQRLDRMAEETHALDRIGEAVSSGGPLAGCIAGSSKKLGRCWTYRVWLFTCGPVLRPVDSGLPVWCRSACGSP